MKPEDEYPTEDQIKELIEYSRANRRVCPLPYKWRELWEMLPGKKETAKGWEPSLPLILGGWTAPPIFKWLAVEEHIRYAAKHGVFKQVDDFLRGLKEEEWAHLGKM